MQSSDNIIITQPSIRNKPVFSKIPSIDETYKLDTSKNTTLQSSLDNQQLQHINDDGAIQIIDPYYKDKGEYYIQSEPS